MRTDVQEIDQGKTGNEAAQISINLRPAGKARIKVGYGNLEATATNFNPVNVGKTREGVDLGIREVPTVVKFIARQMTGGK